MSPPSTTPHGTIVCVVTPWYFKRMAMMSGLLAFFALWFYKDGKWTWPEERRQAEVLADYHRLRDDYDKAKSESRLEAWTAEAKAKDYPLTSEGMLIKTAAFAAQKNWPEEPKLRTPDEIAQQFYYAGGAGIAVLIIGVFVLLNRNKKLIGEADHLVTPEGTSIAYTDVFRVDKRKWDNKGLAYLTYRKGTAEKKAVIDDLKYDGAVHVLDRVLSRFTGELIEKQQETDEAEEATESEATAADKEP